MCLLDNSCVCFNVPRSCISTHDPTPPQDTFLSALTFEIMKGSALKPYIKI